MQGCLRLTASFYLFGVYICPTHFSRRSWKHKFGRGKRPNMYNIAMREAVVEHHHSKFQSMEYHMESFPAGRQGCSTVPLFISHHYVCMSHHDPAPTSEVNTLTELHILYGSILANVNVQPIRLEVHGLHAAGFEDAVLLGEVLLREGLSRR